ncbi:MAG: hypothetical protein HYX47_12770 [Burkholderiales bacterium]|nr:hypothetical protein [Burkholderiales bacterium]
MNWFEVDRAGLAKVLERRGKGFLLFELVGNAWDEAATEVDITLERIAGTRNVRLCVRDNNPDGFADLRHAWVLWASSKKSADAGKRGRFNMGEKLVLALAESAEIASTRGTVLFDRDGRHQSRKRLAQGSCITVVVRMTEDERAECDRAARTLLAPAGVATRYNGEELPHRAPEGRCELVLATELADDEGRLRRTQRKTSVAVHQPLEGETPMIYELGVPIVESGLPWHVDVGQKVPLAFDRDNVPPAFLAKLRAGVLEVMHGQLDAEKANGAWVRDAFEHHGGELSQTTVAAVLSARFGDRRVSYDPSDPEANSRAVAAGYTVVHGSQMSAAEWSAARGAGAIEPAGRVTPSPRPYVDGGRPLKLVAEEDWTEEMQAVVGLAKRLASRLLGTGISVRIAMEPTWPFGATYGPGHLVFNAGRLGREWFGGPLADILDLLLHEFGHHHASDHLSDGYHKALTRLGGALASLALAEPALFRLDLTERQREGALHG